MKVHLRPGREARAAAAAQPPFFTSAMIASGVSFSATIFFSAA
jgi:hypothetical protein